MKDNLGHLLNRIDDECERLCSRVPATILRCVSVETLKQVQFNELAQVLQEKAPTIWSILSIIATSSSKYVRKTDHHEHESMVLAAGLLLKARCTHMSMIPYLVSLILWQGNASKKVN